MKEQSISTVWPEWSVVEQIGSGSYGTVYKAVRQEHGIESFAAIKVISIPQTSSEIAALQAEGLSLSKTRKYYEGVVNEFVNEIRVMESLKGVQNIVGVEDYKVVPNGEIGWDIYIRMELLTPFDQYAKNRTITEEDVIKIGCDICTALEICGKRDVIHRDIKPENIFVNDFGFFKLGDFGVARKLENLSGSLSQKGTYNYMAPEVASGLHYDARVDIYSLGIVLYRLLNHNHLPFLTTEAQLMDPMERKKALDRRLRGEALLPPDNASPGMAAVIRKACAFDPQQRYPTPRAFREALLAVKENTPKNVSSLDETTRVRRNPNDPDQTVSVHRVPDYTSPEYTEPHSQSYGQPYSSPYGTQPPGQQIPSFDKAPEKKTSTAKIVLLTLLGVLVVATVIIGTVLITLKSQDDKNDPASDTTTATTQQTEEPATSLPEDSDDVGSTEEDAVEPDNLFMDDEPSEPQEDIQETEYQVNQAVDDYLQAYIQDINNGTYNALYSTVEYGSDLEEAQKRFIQNSSLYEDLLEYDVKSTKRIDQDTYYVTTIEGYDVYNYDSDASYYLEQKCVYKVCKQSNGTWMIRDYVEPVEQLQKLVH